MAWKPIQQMSLADSLLNDHECLKELDDVTALIDWNRIECLFHGIHASRLGQLAWPPLMIKVLPIVKTRISRKQDSARLINVVF